MGQDLPSIGLASSELTSGNQRRSKMPAVSVEGNTGVGLDAALGLRFEPLESAT